MGKSPVCRSTTAQSGVYSFSSERNSGLLLVYQQFFYAGLIEHVMNKTSTYCSSTGQESGIPCYLYLPDSKIDLKPVLPSAMGHQAELSCPRNFNLPWAKVRPSCWQWAKCTFIKNYCFHKVLKAPVEELCSINFHYV